LGASSTGHGLSEKYEKGNNPIKNKTSLKMFLMKEKNISKIL
jgi:hypothetical protein